MNPQRAEMMRQVRHSLAELRPVFAQLTRPELRQLRAEVAELGTFLDGLLKNYKQPAGPRRPVQYREAR